MSTNLNLNQLLQGALTESVLQHIAGRIGCAPESAKRVVSLCGPALIGAMMNTASSLEGARSLFSAIMSPATNALIAEELPHFVAHDDSFKTLVADGARTEPALASRDSLNLLAERVAEYTGVGASATRTLTGVVGATLLGVLKRHFTHHGAHASQLPALLGDQLPAVRANMTDTFAQALGLGSVGAFLAGVTARLKAVSAHLEHPATQEAAAFSHMTADAPAAPERSAAAPSDDAGKRRWWWLALAAALALLAVLLGRGCTTEEKPGKDAAPAAKPDAAAGSIASAAAAADTQASAPAVQPTKDATMSFNVDAGGVPTLTATVNSEAERQRLIDTLAAKLGADKFRANIVVDPETKPASWLDKLDGLLPVMALPGAQVRVSGETVDLDGRAADASLGWLDKLKAFFGDGWTIGAASASAASPASAASEAPAAAKALAASDARAAATCAGELGKRMNANPIKFGLGSNALPQGALAELATSAKALKDCSAAGTPVKLQIGGFTDSSGPSDANVRLSQKRAQAVRTYLIRHGVPAETLTAEGFGDANPIGDNATRAGRSANRRIEFKELN